MRGDVDEWFDTKQFRHDVLDYMHRQRINLLECATWVDMHPAGMTGFLTEGKQLVLRVAVGLAEVCDLSLDTYRLTPKEHDEYMNQKANQPTTGR